MTPAKSSVMRATSSGAIHGFVKSPGHAMVDLGDIPGSVENRATCINNQGIIGGWCRDKFLYKACRWLKIGEAYQVTVLRHNEIFTGLTMPDIWWAKKYHAMVKTPGGLVDLGPLPGGSQSTATGINNANTIVGFSLDRLLNPHRLLLALLQWLIFDGDIPVWGHQ